MPEEVVTEICPVVAPAGTLALIWVVEVTVSLAALPLNLTEATLEKFPPLMVTFVPYPATVGEKPVMVGRALARKLLVLTADPANVAICHECLDRLDRPNGATDMNKF